MPGEINVKWTKIKKGGGKVFFQFIPFLSLLFDGGDEGTSVNNGNVKRLHGCKDTEGNFEILRLGNFFQLYLTNDLDSMINPKKFGVHPKEILKFPNFKIPK